jgi:hypothetical protein
MNPEGAGRANNYAGRKTEGVMNQQGNDLFNQKHSQLRNSVRSFEPHMKTYDQLVSKFSNEPGLVYRDMFIYPNNSCYRGQMKKKDETCKGKLSESTS